jgi:vesicle transport through interaction with t-SNAREs protein 1
MDILRNYEQQFGILCADITNKISRSINSSDRNAAIANIENLFSEAREIIEQMELEIRDLNSSQKRTPEQKEKYLNIINSYKSELDKLELEFNKQLKNKNKFQSANFEIELNEGKEDSFELTEAKEQNQTTLLKMNKNLDNGFRMVLETEETGKNILSDLFSQRETMERARDRMRDINSNLGKSSRVVGAMTRKILQNKIILFGMCALLILTVIFIIYILIRKRTG